MSAATAPPLQRAPHRPGPPGVGATGWTLVLVEVRHLAASPLPWLGVVLSASAAVRSMHNYWPTLAGDDALTYHYGFLVGSFLLASGALLGIRDRRTRVREVLGSSATPAWKLWALRLGALAIAAGGAFALVFLASLIASVVRGGLGQPDLRLLLDGVLGTSLAAWVGYAVGAGTGSLVLSLFAAPLWGFLSFQPLLYPTIAKYRLSFEWLPPTPRLPDRSVDIGFLPDIFRLHPLFLLGLMGLVGGLLILAGVDGGVRARLRSVGAMTTVAGVVLASVAGFGLLRQPDSVLADGPDRTAWRPLYHSLNGLILTNPFVYPDDGTATACASGRTLTACVFPAYGKPLAQRFVSLLDREATFLRGFPGAPTRLRMVPASGEGCRDARPGRVVYQENQYLIFNLRPEELTGYLIHCLFVDATGSYDLSRVGIPTPAQNTVALWMELQIGEETLGAARAALAQPPLTCPPGEKCDPVYFSVLSRGQLFWTAAEVRAGVALDALPPARVRALLLGDWSNLIDGSLSIKDLPGQTP